MDATSLIKRGAPAVFPHELTVNTSQGPNAHRIEKPITDEDLRAWVVIGQVQAISVRVAGADVEVHAGLQRWKRATVVNHVAGVHRYKGPIQAVRDCIERIKGTDLEKDIIERYPKGMKLAVTLYRGDEHEAARAQRVENSHRIADTRDEMIASAQASAKAGFSPEEIAADMKVSSATVRAWLARDLSKPKVRKARTKVVRPGPKKLAAVHALIPEGSGAADVGARIVLGWVLGQVPDAELRSAFPEVAGAFEKSKRIEATAP